MDKRKVLKQMGKQTPVSLSFCYSAVPAMLHMKGENGKEIMECNENVKCD